MGSEMCIRDSANSVHVDNGDFEGAARWLRNARLFLEEAAQLIGCLLYTSDAADERSSVDLGGRRIIKKKKRRDHTSARYTNSQLHITSIHIRLRDRQRLCV